MTIVKIKFWGIFAVLCLVTFQVLGQQQLNFEITKFDLPIPSRANTILEDKYGFIWVGALNGLWRYDGRSFKHYQKEARDSTALTDNNVKALYEDSEGTLWVGTYGGGLLKYHRACDCFQRYIHEPDNPNSLSFNEVQVIFESSQKQLFVGTDGRGLDLFDRAKETFTNYRFSESDSTTISHNNVLSIAESEEGTIYVGTWIGLNIFNPITGKFQRILKPNQGTPQAHFSLAYFSDKLITNHFDYLDNQKHLEKLPITDHWSADFLLDKNNRFWTLGSQGVTIYDTLFRQKSIIPYPQLTDKFNEDRFTFANAKKNGKIWLLNISTGQLLLIEEKPKIYEQFLTDKTTHQIIHQGDYFWTVQGKSILVYHHKEHSLDTELVGFTNPVITKSNRGGVWVVDGDKYSYYHAAGKKQATFDMPINYYPITAMESLDNHLWVGKILGANKYKLDTDIYTPFDGDPNQPNGIGYFHQTNVIFQDYFGNIWIGTDGDGLKKYQVDDDSFVHYRHVIGDEASISSNFVHQIFEDSQHNLWMGTRSGLCRLDKQTNTFIRCEEGILKDQTIHAIQEGQNGELWLGTLGGLIRYHPKTGENRILNEEDGILSNELNSTSLKLEDGCLVFGTRNGLMVFDPKAVQPSSDVPNIYFSKLWINNELVRPGSKYIAQNIEVEEEILMDYQDSKFELSFAVIHFKNNQRCQYAYKLEGFDDNWTEISGEPKATYTNIPPGKYLFQVKASNADGIWDENYKQIRVTIEPAFWQIGWVQLLGMLLFGFTFLFLFSLYIKRERARNRFELEKARVQQAEEITQLKLRFFTNISHELRTPLTLITAPLNKYIQSNVMPKASVLEMMYKNSNRLLELVNQVLDFRKLENNQQTLNVRSQKNLLLLNNIHAAYSYWSEDKQIDFVLNLPKTTHYCYFDADVVEKIVTNLISNAFKFTPEQGRIELTATFQDIIESDKDRVVESGNLSIVVKDTGAGIPLAKQQQIFERFYQLNDNASPSYGSGIGLSLTNQLVKLHGGTIQLQSVEGVGTSFMVALPIGRKQYVSIVDTEELTTNSIKQANQVQILIAEDNEDIRNYLADELGEKYVVSAVRNGKEALKIALSTIPDLIISDVMMPEMDGIQLANQIKSNELTAHIPFLFLTAKGAIHDKLTGLSTGAEDYIQKPFNVEAIKLKVKNILENRKRQIEKFNNTPVESLEIKEDKFLQKVNAIILENLADPTFSVEILSQQLSIGRSQLYRKLLTMTGKSTI
ncbi:MAG: two-component regulator propeller domain-containing protein, partial [Bacteroidota bacterium]